MILGFTQLMSSMFIFDLQTMKPEGTMMTIQGVPTTGIASVMNHTTEPVITQLLTTKY